MITGPLKCLRHEQQVRAVIEVAVLALEVTAEKSVTDLIELGIVCHYPLRRFDTALHESLVDVLQHFFQNFGHCNQGLPIILLQPASHSLQTLRNRPGQISDTLEVDAELQAGE